MCASTTVHVRIDSNTKARATKVLDGVGLSVPDGVRLFMQRVADGYPPFPIDVPNAATRVAIDGLNKGGGKRFDSAEELFKDLRCLLPITLTGLSET